MIGRQPRQLRTLLAKHIPDSQVTGNKTHFPPTKSPICAALNGTTTSTCWIRAPLFSQGIAVSVAAGAFTSNGQLVTLDQNGQVRRWDLDSQHEDEASRRDLPAARQCHGPRLVARRTVGRAGRREQGSRF